jgi:Tfp pilus assembly PilM family ATPase
VREELIDLQSEGLVSADETKTHLQSLLENWGRPPLALALPQHLSTSQVIDLPITPESEVDKLIQDETRKLGGVSDTRIVYDFVRTESDGKSRQRFWVTIAQEEHIRDRIHRLGVEQEDLCEVTTIANALITAYRAAAPLSSRAILVHLGAQTTVLVVLVGGQAAYATSFQMGGDFFTRALARLSKGAEETAEIMKRQTDFFSGPDAAPEFVVEVEGWVTEVKRQLNEWFEHNPAYASEANSFVLVASGGGFEQPGFLDYLRNEGALELQLWPREGKGAVAQATLGFEVAWGTALQALGYSLQPASLLPADYRAAWKKRLAQQRLEMASMVVAMLCIVLLALGTWYKTRLIDRKTRLHLKTTAALQAWEANDLLSAELSVEYETLRPLFAAEQNTLDTLKTLSLLQQSRSNRSFWYVLLADQQSYFNPPASMIATNRLLKTNNTPAILGPFPLSLPVNAPTNISPARPGLIVELSSPEAGEASRATLSQLVNQLKQQPLFSKVDSLSDDLRRNLAEGNVIIPDKHFALSLFFAETGFQQPLLQRKSSTPPRAGPRRPGRSLRSNPDPMATGGPTP